MTLKLNCAPSPPANARYACIVHAGATPITTAALKAAEAHLGSAVVVFEATSFEHLASLVEMTAPAAVIYDNEALCQSELSVPSFVPSWDIVELEDGRIARTLTGLCPITALAFA